MSERTRTNLWGAGLLLALVALAFFATTEAQGQVSTYPEFTVHFTDT